MALMRGLQRKFTRHAYVDCMNENCRSAPAFFTHL